MDKKPTNILNIRDILKQNNQDELEALREFLESDTANKISSGYEKKEPMSLADFEIRQELPESIPNYKTLINKKNKERAGTYSHNPAKIYAPDVGIVEIPELVTVDYPSLEPEYKGRGIAKQLYKQIEKDTGKIIMPDSTLTKDSARLHHFKGLGKEFGSDNYKPILTKRLNEAAEDYLKHDYLGKLSKKSAEEMAEEAYERIKSTMRARGLTNFKSLLLPAAGGALSLASDAAEAEELGGPDQNAFERELSERKRRDKNLKSASPKEKETLESIYEDIDNPKFDKLRKLLRN